MLIKLNDGVPEGLPLIESNFRQLFPQVSFPAPLTPEDIESYGYGIYETAIPPTIERYEKIEEAAPTKGVDGIWRQTWNIVAMTAEEEQAIDKIQADIVRSVRNGKLNNCDWTQLSDSPVNGADWLSYRQALRDVTSQAGFPWEVTWPAEPA